MNHILLEPMDVDNGAASEEAKPKETEEPAETDEPAESAEVRQWICF